MLEYLPPLPLVLLSHPFPLSIAVDFELGIEVIVQDIDSVHNSLLFEEVFDSPALAHLEGVLRVGQDDGLHPWFTNIFEIAFEVREFGVRDYRRVHAVSGVRLVLLPLAAFLLAHEYAEPLGQHVLHSAFRLFHLLGGFGGLDPFFLVHWAWLVYIQGLIGLRGVVEGLRILAREHALPHFVAQVLLLGLDYLEAHGRDFV
mmetsp:Transcript_37524/g.57483  ORF Transcript_37524/g.57483 Transcript_37524/m.57483 type:complete len:201 (-) Transcript_37524:602-1204(-)